jgi:hypothetical protein
MSRHTLVLIPLLGSSLLLGNLVTLASVSAQLVPPAGTAGAGLTPIHGVPFGPNNPSALSDPSGQLNASKLPPLQANPPLQPPPPQPVYGPLASPRRVNPPYASQRVFSANQTVSGNPAVRRQGQRQGRRHVSHFTGICRGC